MNVLNARSYGGNILDTDHKLVKMEFVIKFGLKTIRVKTINWLM